MPTAYRVRFKARIAPMSVGKTIQFKKGVTFYLAIKVPEDWDNTNFTSILAELRRKDTGELIQTLDCAWASIDPETQLPTTREFHVVYNGDTYIWPTCEAWFDVAFIDDSSLQTRRTTTFNVNIISGVTDV